MATGGREKADRQMENIFCKWRIDLANGE